ncbi:MAG: AAA family ATPase [Ignavibacteriae bacterium]|nr:AAA family ATPase [Ignavibacteriota bacterium]
MADLTSDQLRAAFNARVDRWGKGAVSRAAKSIGCSASVLSMWRQGRYAGDNAGVDIAVRAWLERVDERESVLSEERLPFLDTSIARAVFEVAKRAHVHSGMYLVCGPSGVGKSRAVREYAMRNPDVILVECHRMLRTRELIGDLHRAVGLDGKGTVHHMMRDLVEKLRDSGRLIIVDEAENLSAASLDEVRRLHDWADVGVLYVGLERLYFNLRQMRGDFEYIINRIRNYRRLDNLKPADTALFVSTQFERGNGSDALTKAYHSVSRGNARVLRDLIFDSLEVSRVNKTAVTREMIEAIAEEGRV